MRRREFIGLLGSAAVAWPLSARAQRGERLRRIGVLANTHPSSSPGAQLTWDAFIAGLRDAGWVGGRNLTIEARWADGKDERFAEFAAELVALNVDVIVALGSTTATEAAKRATSAIPIVFVGISHPIESGFAATFARPGANLTGLANQLGDLWGKIMDLLREIRPDLARIAVMWEPVNSGSFQGHKAIDEVTSRVGMSLVSLPIGMADDVERAFATIVQEQPQVLVLHPTPIIFLQAKQIIAFAIAQRLPTFSPVSSHARQGGLISYGPDLTVIWARGAHYVDRLLRGEKAAEMPVGQPTKFQLVINLKTAKALGLEITASLLARADEIIE
jgi:putative tryptophan/tyrosine transport system substrate-binding protein